MIGELMQREIMKPTQEHPEYLGALLEDERRMVLISVDPNDPWQAFKRMRRALRKETQSAKAVVNLFETDIPLERPHANVIDLTARRNAG